MGRGKWTNEAPRSCLADMTEECLFEIALEIRRDFHQIRSDVGALEGFRSLRVFESSFARS
jgi:hypothetical protein